LPEPLVELTESTAGDVRLHAVEDGLPRFVDVQSEGEELAEEPA
jgi:hypothetical protein